MSILLLAAGFGATLHPFWPLLLYYFLAVLRPSFLWYWALPHGVPWSMMAAGLVGISLLVYGSRVARRVDLNLPTVLLAFIAFWLVVANMTAVDPSASWRWAEPVLKIVAAALVATLVIDRVEHVRLVAISVFVALGYIAWYINSLYYFDGRLDVLHDGFGGFDNNGAALMVASGIPFAFAVWRMPREHWGLKLLGWAAVPASVMMLHALMLTYSRGAMLACLAGLGWLAIWHRPRSQALLAMAGLAVCVAVLAGPEVRSRFSSVAAYQDDASALQRIESWNAGWRMVWQRPFTGFGSRGTMPYLQAYAEDTTTPVVHNQYLQFASDGGVPLALAFAALLVVAMLRFRSAGRACRAVAADEPLPPGGAAAGSGGSAGMSDWPWDRLGEPEPKRVRAWARSDADLWLALESVLITLAIGGLFLSIEAFELLWMLLGLGCVAARVSMSRQAAELAEPAFDASTEPPAKRPSGRPPVKPTLVPA
ncbi:MAG: O-antigen ligase family protein [Planctomycetota bacterium]